LEFWIEQAHNRGIELHAWLNPYRAHHVRGGEVTEASIVKRRPELVVKLSSGYYWLDPADQRTQDHSYNVVMDIIKRYDVTSNMIVKYEQWVEDSTLIATPNPEPLDLEKIVQVLIDKGVISGRSSVEVSK